MIVVVGRNLLLKQSLMRPFPQPFHLAVKTSSEFRVAYNIFEAGMGGLASLRQEDVLRPFPQPIHLVVINLHFAGFVYKFTHSCEAMKMDTVSYLPVQYFV